MEVPHHPLCIFFISCSHEFGKNVLSRLSRTGMYTFWNNCPVNSSKQHLLCVSRPNPAGSHSVVPVNYVDATFCPLLGHLLQDIKQTYIVQTREIEREGRYSLVLCTLTYTWHTHLSDKETDVFTHTELEPRCVSFLGMISVRYIPACICLTPLLWNWESHLLGFLPDTSSTPRWNVHVETDWGRNALPVEASSLSVSIDLPASYDHNNNRAIIPESLSDRHSSLTWTEPWSAFQHSWQTTCSHRI